MDDYIKKENFKFVLTIIIMAIIGLFISGMIDEYEENKKNKIYKEAYEEGYYEGYNEGVEDTK